MKSFTQRVAFRISQQANGLLREDGWIAQLPLFGKCQKLLVRKAFPQEERQTGRQLKVGQPVHIARDGRFRVVADPE